MRYSDMTPEQRQLLLDDPENYPLRVKFLGKTGLLSIEAINLLRGNEVDFDVDDRQVWPALGPETTVAAGGLDALVVSAASWAISGALVAWRLLRGGRRPPDTG